MRKLVELSFIAAGLLVALVLGWLSAWSYPQGRDDIWLVTWVSMGVIMLMGIGPVRDAVVEDRRRRDG